MKLKYLLILLLLCIIIFTGCSKKEKISGNIINFSYEYGGINGYWKYNIYQEGEKTYVEAKGFNGIDLNKKKQIPNKTFNNIKRIIEEYNVKKWDGFDKTDDYIINNLKFNLRVKYDQGEIVAKGNSFYPSNFEEFHTVITKYLEIIIE